MPGEHALLSPSSAEKWLHCTPSARLEENYSEESSVYAAEGTLAHAIAELKVRKKLIEPMSQKAFTTRMNKLKKHELYQEEMQEYTDIYVDYLTECAMQYKSKPDVAAEIRLDYGDWAPEGFGRCDCVMVGENTLHIIDFKYGKGVPVSAENNEQMRLYALGALQLHSMIYDIKTIRMSIVQPRLDSITEAEMSAADLLSWADDVVRPAAALAFMGEGDCCPGPWCKSKFCKARAQCRAYAESSLTAAEAFGTPPKQPSLLTNEELGQVLERAAPFLDWFKAAEDFALAEMLKGEEIPGWKVVEGRSIRVFTDADAAFAALQSAGFDESLLFKPREHITLSAAEKLAGKAQFQTLCGSFINKPRGKPTLAPEDDKRPLYDSAAIDFAGLTKQQGE